MRRSPSSTSSGLFLLFFTLCLVSFINAGPLTGVNHILPRDEENIPSASASQPPKSTNTLPASINTFSATGNVTAINSTVGLNDVISLRVMSNDSSLSLVTDVAALTPSTGRSLISSGGYEGICVGKLIEAKSNLYIPWPDIALINCDNPQEAKDLIMQTSLQTSDCILLYSLTSSACNLTSSSLAYNTQLGFVMTFLSNSVSQSIVSNVNSSETGSFTGVIQAVNLLTAGNATPNTNENSLSKSTVAMVVLYSITGIVAFLFLFVIISGAIRVHNHPERYGLPPANSNANTGDDPQYSSMYRAKGIARAVLDSIPLVTVRVKNSDSNVVETRKKDSDIELESQTMPADNAKTEARALVESVEPEPAPLASSTPLVLGEDDDSTCPICFEDFEDGQILRVLPCNHKFHALCVDPWLLNSSSHCPMCRVDLSLAKEEEVPEMPPGSTSPGGQQSNAIVIPEGYEVDTSLFNRFLDIWNAHLLPKEARRTALAKFQQEAELRRQLRSQRSRNNIVNDNNNSFDSADAGPSSAQTDTEQHTMAEEPHSSAHNQNIWLRFVASRRKLYHMRRRESQHDASTSNAPAYPEPAFTSESLAIPHIDTTTISPPPLPVQATFHQQSSSIPRSSTSSNKTTARENNI
ncbi:Conserved hypothetical protein. Putative Zinc finger, RING-type domain protein [Geotrichum candidum]|uniref:RING-type domain-containing protein n=1 Tax=Geotrichum candidum TaxID=1173061 RepID=A0A0J9X909_GEOCN|nr:Conserved hypothetical protein. Putative Zinc finger, RING-type domain protein [Geotrichum candidum]